MIPSKRKHRPVLSAALLLLAAHGAIAADLPAISVEPEVLTAGPTVEEYFDEQRSLYGRLTQLLPDGAIDRPIEVVVTSNDLAALAEGGLPQRIGLVKPVAPAIELSDLREGAMVQAVGGAAGGAIREMTDGGYVWARAVGSEGAGGIRIHLTNFSLPQGVDLYFFNAEGDAFGPYRELGPNGDGDFWAPAVLSSTGFVVLEVSGSVKPGDLRRASLTIADVGHIDSSFVRGLAGAQVETRGVAFCGNPSCVVDASCYNVAAVSGAKNAVAKMEWIAGAFIYTCTGGLLADTDNSTQIPYFLTANHCLSSNNTAQNVDFYWFFRTSSCNGSCPNDANFPRTHGSTVKATGSSADFTLLQCSQTPPAGAVFLGWNNTAVAFTNGLDLYRISHPNFGPQVFSHHRVDTGAPTCTGWSRGPRIYSRDIEGGIDGGSSGSPVVNSSGQVVGQLSGTCGFNSGDPCDSAANATVDGALASYWNSVSQFLNPSAGGCGGRNSPCDSNDDCCSNQCRSNGRCR